MGLFSSDDNEPSETDNLINQQYQENAIQIEQKRRALFSTRLDIIKSQGAPNWGGNAAASGMVNMTGNKPGATSQPGLQRSWGKVGNHVAALSAELNKSG